MATDLIVWAWAVFVLRTVLSEVPEGLGPVSGSTGGYGPDSLNSTSGEAADSSSHEPKPHQSLSLHKPETLGNPDVQWILANPLSSRRVPFGSKYGHKVLGSSQEGRGDSNTAVPPSYSSALPSNPGGMVVHPSSSTKFPQGQSYQSSAFNVIQPTNSKLFQNKDAPSMGQDAPNPSEPGSQDAPNPSEPGRPDAPGAGSDASSMGQDAPSLSEPGSQDAPNPSEPGSQDATGIDAPSMGQDAPNPSEPGSQDATGPDAPSMGQDAPNPSEPGRQDAPGAGQDASSMGRVNDRVLRRFPEQFLSQKTQNTVYRWPVSSIQLQSQHSGAVQTEQIQARPQTNDRVLQRFPERFTSQKPVDVMQLNEPNSKFFQNKDELDQETIQSSEMHEPDASTVYRWPVSSIQLQSQHSGAVQTEQIQAGPQTNDRVLQRFPERFISQKPVDVMQLNEPNSKFFQNKDELDQETIQSSEMHEPDASTVYRWPVSSIQLQSQHSGAVQTEQIQAGPQTNDRVLQRFPERFISQKPVDVMQLNEPNSKFFQNKDELDQEPIQSSEMHEPDASTAYRWPVSSIQLQSQHSGAVQTERRPSIGADFQARPQYFAPSEPGRPGAGSDASSMGQDAPSLSEPGSQDAPNPSEPGSQDATGIDAPSMGQDAPNPSEPGSQDATGPDAPSMGQDAPNPSEPGRQDAPGAGQDASSMGRVNDRVLRRFPEQFLSQKTQNTVYRWPVSSIQLQSQHSGAVQTEQIQARPQTNDRVLQRFPERFTSQKPVDVMQLNEPNSKFFQNKDELDQETIQSSEMHEPDASTVYRWPVSSIQLQSQHSGAVQTEQIQAGPQTNDRVLQRFPERFISQKPVDVMQLNEPNSKFFQNKDELDQEPIQSSEMHEPDASTAYRWPVSSIQLQSQHSGAVQTERRPSIGADFQARPQYFAPSEPGRPDAPGAGSDASSMGQDAPSPSELGSQDATGPDAPSMGQDAPNPSEPGSQDAPNPSEPGRQDAPGAGPDASSMGRVNDRVLQRFPEQYTNQKTVDVIKVLNDPNSESLYGSKTSQEAKRASNVLHQKEQGSQQPIQSTDTTVSHGVQMLEPSKTNPVQSPNEFYSEPDPQFGSEGTLRPGSQSAATATEILGTTSGYLSPHEPKYRLPAQTSSSYSYGTSGQLANKGDPVPSGSHGPIRSQGGVEGRQPSGEQNLPSRVDSLNRLKQALHNVSRGHLFHSVMQRLIPASSPSWNMGEGWDFLGSAENSPSLTGDQSHFGDDGNDLSTSVSRGETSSSKSSISHAPENVGSGKSDGGVMSPSPLVNVYGSGSSSALSNAVSSHRGNDGSARKGTTIQQTTKEAPKGPLQMSAACLTRKVIPAQRRIPAKSFYRKMSAVKPAKHHWPLLTPKRFRKLRVLEGKCEGAAHKL
ncbi:accumulation-associated protein-like isoform X22 [Clupea harengus]|uniref:Accumulation-associated protein-like isoform X22 n=1 Tax=Clupea harengus TaxID=7950 RepID=A0A6P8GQL2_CLUHA|nr:accumulation-associated protein-like isoform X22 [Clupea harengus]